MTAGADPAPATEPKVEIYDTTLRDGSQQVGLDLTVTDKLRVAAALDALGVDVIEGGWPGSNPKDAEFFERADDAGAGATRSWPRSARPGRRGGRPTDDANLAALLGREDADRDAGRQGLDAARRRGAADHPRGEPRDGRRVGRASSAARAGGWCSTPSTSSTGTGPTAAMPSTSWPPPPRRAPTRSRCATPTAAPCPTTSAAIMRRGRRPPPGARSACTSTTTRVLRGRQLGGRRSRPARLHVQGAANGYGERCGNADLFSVIASLELKRGHELLPPGRLAALASTARTIAELANLPFESRQPYVGPSAFATKAGLHASAIARRPDAYSHVDPGLVGNQAQVLVSELAGRSNVLAKAAELGLDLSGDPALATASAGPDQGRRAPGIRVRGGGRVVRAAGAQDAGVLPTWFELEGYRVVIERGAAEDRSEAIVRLLLGEDRGRRRRRGRRPGARTRPGAAPRPGRAVPGAGQHPPGRLQGAHPGRPGADQRGHPGDADLGRSRRRVDDRRVCRRT